MFFLLKLTKSWPKPHYFSIIFLKSLKYAFMHLYQKQPKYAFAYAYMQMHNYPKPSHNYNLDKRN